MTASEKAAGSPPPTEEQVLGEISTMISALVEDYGLDPAEITMTSSLTDDLELESIDLVSLSERMQERWGDRVNLAEFVAGLDLDDLIDLTVGRLVGHVVDRLRTEERS